MDNGEYFTKDLYEASFLYTERRKLLRLEKEGDFYWFVFENSMGICDSSSNDFWAEEGLVVPKRYADSIVSLKNRLFARK